jgi:bacterioferritin-associated ferredoxin
MICIYIIIALSRIYRVIEMYVCICNRVTDTDIRDAVCQGASNLNQLSEQLNLGTCCGKCKSCAERVLREASAEQNCISPAAVFPVGTPEPALA